MWVLTAVGLGMLWSATGRIDVPHSGRTLTGGLLLGWGLFNVVEGIIDHHILNLHHVYERAGQSVWDWLFLAFGGALISGGWLLMTGGAGHRPKDEPPTSIP